MSLTAKALHDRYQASKAGHRAVGDPPLPVLDKASHEEKVGWDAVAYLANEAIEEAAKAHAAQLEEVNAKLATAVKK